MFRRPSQGRCHEMVEPPASTRAGDDPVVARRRRELQEAAEKFQIRLRTCLIKCARQGPVGRVDVDAEDVRGHRGIDISWNVNSWIAIVGLLHKPHDARPLSGVSNPARTRHRCSTDRDGSPRVARTPR